MSTQDQTNLYVDVLILNASQLNVKTATKYISDKLTVKATRRQKSRSQQQFIITIGRPNYAERQFIKRCKKAGEPFPVKNIQLKMQEGK